MRRLDLGRSDAGLRARRWDAVVLGGALPGLVAAARVAQRGHRVLVVEEEGAARLPGHVREPFFLGAAGPEGVLDACLTELKTGLRDRRRFERTQPSYQVALPGLRMDVGGPTRTREELLSWGLAKPEAAERIVEELLQGSASELRLLREAPLVRRGALRGLGFARSATGEPTLPAELTQPHGRLARLFDTQLRALAPGCPAPPPGAQLLLLGAAVGGASTLTGGGLTLRRLLRRRLEELHGEMRTVRGFELASVDQHPGLLLRESREAWLGRALVLNAPLGLVADVVRAAEARLPAFLAEAPRPSRGICLDLRCEPDVLPVAMARRVIHAAGDEEAPDIVTLTLFPGAAAHEPTALALRARPREGEAPDATRQRALDTLRELVPFSDGRLAERLHAPLVWDDDEACTTGPVPAWPPELQPRLGTRRPVYALRREEVAALGSVGDLLLGWRAGDAIAAELG